MPKYSWMVEEHPRLFYLQNYALLIFHVNIHSYYTRTVHFFQIAKEMKNESSIYSPQHLSLDVYASNEESLNN